MFELLKRWYSDWDEGYRKQEERAAHDWANGLIECGQVSSVERFVESAADFGERNAFDRGVLRALQTWRESNESLTVFATPVDVDVTKEPVESIPMILHCPMCYAQHIDKPDFRQHTSHLCARCGFIWRPADVPTVGVSGLKTCGTNDTDPEDWSVLRSEAEGFLAEAVYQWYDKLGLSDIGVFKFAERVVLWARQRPEERLPALRRLGAALESAVPNRCARFRHRDTGKTFVYMTLAKYKAGDTKSIVIYKSEASGQVWAMAHDDFYDGRFEHLLPDA